MNSIKYFSFKELTQTKVKIKNTPTTWEEIDNLRRLAEYLDRIRTLLNAPIKVNSGFRTELVNIAVRGAKKSAHMLGMAADIEAVSGLEEENRRICSLIEEIGGFDQLIVYHDKVGVPSSKIRFIHLGFRNENPRALVMHQ